MEVHEIVQLREHNLITTPEARQLIGYGEHDDITDRVNRVRIELREALASKGGAIEWRIAIERALSILG